MKKRLLSFLLVLAMVLTLLPVAAFAAVTETDVCKIGEGDSAVSYESLAAAITAVGELTDKTIVLLADIEGEKTDNGYTPFDFGNKTLTLDLNGFKLTGASSNAANVTIANSGAKKATLEATGLYANNVSAFAADYYDGVDSSYGDTENDGRNVIRTDTAGLFTVKVVTTINDDRATTRTDATASPSDEGYVYEQDVYEGDTVKVEIRVYGARFVGADITFKYDKEKFRMSNMPMSGWTGDTDNFPAIQTNPDSALGYARFQNAKAGAGATYYQLNKMDEEGKPYYSLGKFEFKARACEEDTFDIPFQVRAVVDGDAAAERTVGLTSAYGTFGINNFVTGPWADGHSSTAATPLTKDQLVNAFVNIRMVKMTANVTAAKLNGENLVYNATEQNLLNPEYSVVDPLRNNQAVTGTTIKYIVQTKDQAYGVQATDPDTGELLYYEDDGSGSATTTETTTKTNHPKYVENKEPVARGNEWGDTMKATDAGDYVVYYQITKTGYATIEGKIETTIDKKEMSLTWVTTGFTAGEKTGEECSTPATDYQYWTNYGGGDEKAMPTASFTFANTQHNAVVAITKFDKTEAADGTKLQNVGVYELTATFSDDINKNYDITGSTINVMIDGNRITGYSLDYADNEDEWKWYDAQGHTPAKLVTAEGATASEEDKPLTIKYTVLKNGVEMAGKTNLEAIPTDITEVGTYTVKAVASKQGCYDLELNSIDFTIKSVEFKVEWVNWVTGWDVVFVYTNEPGVHFTYDGKDMFDMSSLTVNGEKYKFENTEYTYVYGIAVCGDANTNLVVSSNGGVKSINNYQGDVKDARCNINNSESRVENAPDVRRGVDVNDMVACQAIYNVNEEYLNPNGVSEANMAVILKADVNGDKMVDTDDCSLIKANTENVMQ